MVMQLTQPTTGVFQLSTFSKVTTFLEKIAFCISSPVAELGNCRLVQPTAQKRFDTGFW